MDATRRLDKIEKTFFKEWIKRNPLLGTTLGLHAECDDRLPDGTIERELDDHKLFHRTLSEVQKIDPRKLPANRAVDREFMIYALNNWIFEREELRLWERLPEAPRVIGLAIYQILARNYAPQNIRMRAIMKRLDLSSKYVDQTRSKLVRPVKHFVEIELESLTRLPGFFNTLRDIGREHMPPTPQRNLHRLIEESQNALQKYEDWLIVDVLPDCRDDYPIGEDMLRKLLHVRGVNLTPGQIINRAEDEIARVRDRQRELARTIRRKMPVEDVRDLIKQQHPDSIEGVMRYMRDWTAKSRQFVTRSRFAVLPDSEQLYIVDTPPFLRHFHPLGTYGAPTRFDPKMDGYLYVTPGDCDSDKLKEHNYGSLTNMALHLGYPGRHLQRVWATAHPSTTRTLFQDPATEQGWSYYCEERAKEMGFDDAAPARFMQLQSSLLAAVRALLDVRLAIGKVTAEQAVESLIDYLGMDRIVAEAEVRRYVTDPGIHAVALFGREKIRQLRKWTREKLKDRFSDTFFHSAILKSGVLPPALLKKELEERITEELQKPVEPGKGAKKKPGKAAKPAVKKAAPKSTPKPVKKKKAKAVKKKAKPRPRKKPKARKPARAKARPKKKSKPKSKPKRKPKARPGKKARPKKKRRR